MLRIELKVVTGVLKFQTRTLKTVCGVNKNIDMFYLFVFVHAFVKLRKTTIRFVMSVCQSACPSVRTEQLGSH
jgi:hypothetical protein